jgi:hypothetical protein
MVAINQDITADADTVVRGIAREWVGEAYAEVLTAAWRDCDTAWMTRPLWLHFGLPKQGLLGPLVPDLARLKPAEIAYYRTIGLDDLERIQGTGSFIPYEADERNRDHVLHELYGKQTLPLLRRAYTSLEQAAQGAPATAAAVLRDQAEYIRYCYLSQRMHAHWYEAGRYLAPGDRPNRERTMAQIIDDELQVTAELVALLDGRAEKFLRVMSSDYMTYEFGPSFVSHLRQRLVVMKAHRDDPPASLKEALAKIIEYQQSLTEYA